ncbi:Csu type fimbrial protein [Sphingomonas parapaucimobilis]|uniref:Csu type fimbrial protein n=1 Tax=Sphingomonas parapaucimobilis TaxID=28213 RepID=UPI0039E8044E
MSGRRIVIALAVLVPAIMAAAPVAAQDASAAIGVETEIIGACTIGNVTPMAFGTLADPQAAASATGEITLTCSQGMGWQVRIDRGQHYGNGLNMQRVGGRDLLAYAMCGDAGCRTPLTDSVGLTGTGTGQPATVSLVARIAAGQSVTPGDYSDRLTIRVDY